jgi:hypothetical protein
MGKIFGVVIKSNGVIGVFPENLCAENAGLENKV